MKKIKIFKDGVYLRDIYPHSTKFQVLKYRVAQWIGKVVRQFILWLKLGAVATIAMIIGAFIYGTYIGSIDHMVFAENNDTLSVKVDKMKTDVVDTISQLENKTNIPIVIDDNKSGSLPRKDKVSIGCMQFKIGTIEHYYQVLKKGSISDTEAIMLALDCLRSKDLAQEIIFTTQGGIWNWSTATKEMGTKVEIIKSLTK